MAAPTITSVSPQIFAGNGGYKIVLTGTFELDTPYRVHVGPVGDATDPACYAGTGLANDATSKDGTTLTVYLPEMAPGGVYPVFVMERDAPATNGSLVDAVIAVNRDYSTSLWQMKSLFAPNRVMGSRNMAQLPEVTQPQNHLLYSEDFTDPVWQTADVTLQAAQADPFGTSRGCVISEGALTQVHAMHQTVATIAGQVYTASFYAKAMNRDYAGIAFSAGGVVFDLINGITADPLNLIRASIISADHLGDTGWFYCSATWREAATGTLALTMGPAVGPTRAQQSFAGLSQDSIRFALPTYDLWSVERAYRMTAGTVVT